MKRASRSARRHPLAALLAALVLSGAGVWVAVAVAGGPAAGGTTPPVPTLTSQPANPTNQTSATFAFKDSKQVSFLCQLDAGAYSACTSPKTYGGLASGNHTFRVEAKDSLGAVSSPTAYTWRIDTTPPPAPTLTQTPPDPQQASDPSSTFAWSDSDPDGDALTYLCSIDGTTPSSCTSPTGYSPGKLGQGSHTFSVVASDAAGNRSAPASFTWNVVQPVKTFSIGGSAGLTLIPGGSSPLNLTITNPNNFSITVTSIAVTISSVTSAGCSASNFQVTSYAGPGFVAPPGTSPVPNAARPTVSMKSTSSSQDACKDATVNLAYQGIANK